MTQGLRCWDASGRLTFDINIRTVRSTIVQTIGSNSTGSIALSSLPSGAEGVRFVPVLASIDRIAPYTWISGGSLHWRGSSGAHYLTVVDISGLGGSTVMDGDSA